jgi:hypothetical protein
MSPDRMSATSVAHKSTGGTLQSLPEPVDPVGDAPDYLTFKTVALSASESVHFAYILNKAETPRGMWRSFCPQRTGDAVQMAPPDHLIFSIALSPRREGQRVLSPFSCRRTRQVLIRSRTGYRLRMAQSTW